MGKVSWMARYRARGRIIRLPSMLSGVQWNVTQRAKLCEPRGNVRSQKAPQAIATDLSAHSDPVMQAFVRTPLFLREPSLT
jgi:hypothetical protein